MLREGYLCDPYIKNITLNDLLSKIMRTTSIFRIKRHTSYVEEDVTERYQ